MTRLAEKSIHLVRPILFGAPFSTSHEEQFIQRRYNLALFLQLLCQTLDNSFVTF